MLCLTRSALLTVCCGDNGLLFAVDSSLLFAWELYAASPVPGRPIAMGGDVWVEIPYMARAPHTSPLPVPALIGQLTHVDAIYRGYAPYGDDVLSLEGVGCLFGPVAT